MNRLASQFILLCVLTPKMLRLISTGVYINRAAAKYRLGDDTGALADYNKAFELDSKNTAILMNRGAVRSKMKDYQGAIRDFTMAIDLKPTDGSLFHNRAHAKRESGNLKGACDDWNQAVRLGYKAATENLEK